MAFFFNRARPRSPSDIAKIIKDLVGKLWETPGNTKVGTVHYFVLFCLTNNERIVQVEEELAKQLAHTKLIVQGTQGVYFEPPKHVYVHP
jgi:calcium binding protein 39